MLRPEDIVTILILIDGFLQFRKGYYLSKKYLSHNPYFNRWFSAITNSNHVPYDDDVVTILILIDGFLQYVTKIPIFRVVL